MVRIREKLDFILFTLLLSGLLSTQSFAQVCNNQQDDYWLFGGNVFIDFDNPNAPTSSQASSIGATEGCASVADPNGNFLFGTNGRDVEGPLFSNFQVNYNGITLKGGTSSTHAAVAVPNPSNQQEYYIFTAGDSESNLYGINAVKLLLQSNPPYSASVSLPTNNSLLPAGQNTEKLAVARHDNCKDYWVVTHDFGATTNDGKNYISYKVDQNGISTGINSLQTVSHVTASGRDLSMRGQLSFSEDYTTLVAAVFGEIEIGSDPYVSGFIEITNFDKATGSITPDKVLPLAGYNPYGVCLSPSKRYLYVTATDFASPLFNKPDKFVYYDLQAGTIQDILNSEEEIPLATRFVNPLLGQLKIGPNGKLYLSIDGEGVVEFDPEDPDRYTLQTIPYDNLYSTLGVRFGLPQTIPDYCEPTVKAFANPETFCVGEQVSVWANPLSAASPVQYTWNTGQTTSSFLDNPQQTTTYSVSITDYYGCSATGQVEVIAEGFIAAPDFHFEDASGTIKTDFLCGEDVYFNGFASTNEANHYLDLWEVTPSGLSFITSAGWQGGPITSRYDLDDFFGVAFQVGKTYQVKLAVQNLPCTGWDDMVLNFTVTAPVGDANFTTTNITPSGSTATVTLTAASNPPNVEYYWTVTEDQTGSTVAGFPTTWSTANSSVTVTVDTGKAYTIFHAVRNIDCNVFAQETRPLFLRFPKPIEERGDRPALIAKDETVSFNLFPNPATDLINITTDASVESIQVIDTHGRMIKQLHGSERVISINDLPAGIYMVELRTTDTVVHKRFIKT